MLPLKVYTVHVLGTLWCNGLDVCLVYVCMACFVSVNSLPYAHSIVLCTLLCFVYFVVLYVYVEYV